MKPLLGAIFVSFCLDYATAHAQELYRWVDEKGSVHFTDNFHFIPEKYRERAEKRGFPPSVTPPAPSQEPGQPQSASKGQQILVPFARQGNDIIIEGNVNEQGPVRFVLDTGATITLIPEDTARQLGIDLASGDPIRFGGVGGAIPTLLVQIDSLNVGGAEVKDLEIAVQLGQGPFTLLGMDFLSEFQFQVDQVKNVLTLEPVPRPYEGRSLQHWQHKFRYWYDLKKNWSNSALPSSYPPSENRPTRRSKEWKAKSMTWRSGPRAPVFHGS